MKKITLTLASLLLSITSSSWAEINAVDKLPISSFTTSTSNTNAHINDMSMVTASDYCDFLNHAASSDADHLYSQAMASDPSTVSIARVGTPGRWHYQVIAGQENFPIGYVNEVDEEKYSLEQNLPTSENQQLTTSFLKSNLSSFEVAMPPMTAMLTLASSSPTSTSNANSYIEDVSMAAGFIGLLACPELMMRMSSNTRGRTVANERTDIISSSNNHEVTLDHFRSVLQDHPTSSRFIIGEDRGKMSIVPQEAIDNAARKNKEENKKIIDVLKTALQSEHSAKNANAIVGEVIGSFSLMRDVTSRLSAEKLSDILRRADVRKIQTTTTPELFDVEKILRAITSANKRETALSYSYQRADELWAQADQAWKSRPEARWDAEVKAELLQEAHDLHEQEKAEFEEKDIAKTSLAKAAQVADIAAGAAEFVNIPFIPTSAVAKAIPTGLRMLNKRIEETALRSASKELKHAAKNAESAAQVAENAEATAPELEMKAQQEENSIRAADAEKSIALAQAIKPPSHGSDLSLWNKWAEKLAKEVNINERDWVAKIAECAANDPLSAEKIAASVWSERIEEADQVVRDLENQETPEMRAIKALENDFLVSFEKAKNERVIADKAQEKVAAATQRKEEAEAFLIKTTKELNDLENEYKAITANPTAASPERLRKIATTQESKRRDIGEATLQKTVNALETAEQELQEPIMNAAAAEKSAIEKFETYHTRSKSLFRKMDRAKTHASADRVAFAEVWPLLPVPEPLPAVDTDIPVRVGFLKMLQEEIIPSFSSKKIFPGVLEEVGLLSKSAPELASQVIAPEKVERPILLDEIFENLGRKLLGKPSKPMQQQEASVLSPKSAEAIDQVLREAEINLLEASESDHARWDAREKADRLETLEANLRQLNITKNNLPQFISSTQSSHGGNVSTYSGGSFHTAKLSDSSASNQEHANNIRKEKKKADDDWTALAERAERKRIAHGGMPKSREEALDYWKLADRDAVTTRKWARDQDRWSAMREIEELSAEYKKIQNEHGKNSAELEQAEKVLMDARKKWSSLADLTLFSENNFSRLDSNKVRKIKNELAAADQAIYAMRGEILETGRIASKVIPSEGEPSLLAWRTKHLENCFHDAEILYAKVTEAKNSRKTSTAELKIMVQEADQAEEQAAKEYAKRARGKAVMGVREQIPGIAETWFARVEQSGAEAKQARLNFDQLKPSAKTEEQRRKVNRTIAIAQAEQEAYKAAKEEADRLQKIKTHWEAKIEIVNQATQLQIETAANDHYQGDPAAWLSLPLAQRNAYNEIIERANHDASEKPFYDAEERVTEADNLLGMAYEDINMLKKGGRMPKSPRYEQEVIDYLSNDHLSEDLSSSVATGKRNTASADSLASFHHEQANGDNGDQDSSVIFKNPQHEAAHKKILSAQANLDGTMAANALREHFIQWGKLTPPYEDADIALGTRTADLWKNAAEQYQRTSGHLDRAAAYELRSDRFLNYLATQIATHAQAAAENYFQAAKSMEKGKQEEAQQLSHDAEASHHVADQLTHLDQNVSQAIKKAPPEQAARLSDLLSANTKEIEQDLAAGFENVVALSPNAPDFEKAWADLLTKAEEIKADWTKVHQIYQEIQQTLPLSEQKAWQEEVSLAATMEDYSTLRPLLFQAEKAEKIVAAAIEEAKAVTPGDDPRSFEAAWNKAMATIPRTQKAWSHVIQKYQELPTSLPFDDQGQRDQLKLQKVFENDFNKARYRQALCTVLPELLQAYQAEAIEARQAGPRSPNKATVTAWKKAMQHFHSLKSTLPENYQAAWKSDQAWLEAEKAERALAALQNQPLQSHAELDAIKNILARKADLAKSAWHQTAEAIEQAKKSLPLSEQVEWDLLLTAARHYEAENDINTILSKMQLTLQMPSQNMKVSPSEPLMPSVAALLKVEAPKVEAPKVEPPKVEQEIKLGEETKRVKELQEEIKQLQEKLKPTIGKKEEKETLVLREQQRCLLGYLQDTLAAYIQRTTAQLSPSAKELEEKILSSYEQAIDKQKEAIAAQRKNRTDRDYLQELEALCYQKKAQALEWALGAIQEKNEESALAYQAAADAYLQRAEALQQEDLYQGYLQEEKAEYHLGVANALLSATQEEKLGNREGAKLYRDEAEIYREIVTLFSSFEMERELFKEDQINKENGYENRWRMMNESEEEPLQVLEKAAKNYRQGVDASRLLQKSRGAESSYLKNEIQNYKAAAEAWRANHHARASDLEKAAYAYKRAAQEQRRKNPEAALCWKAIGEVHQQGKDQGKNRSEMIWKQGAAEYYQKALEAKAQGFDRAALLFQQQAEKYKIRVDANEEEDNGQGNSNLDNLDNLYLSMFHQGDKKHEVVAGIAQKIEKAYQEQKYDLLEFLKSSGSRFRRAANEQNNKKSEFLAVWLKSAAAYEQKVEALLQGDQEAAERYAQAAKVLGSYKRERSSWSGDDSGVAWAYGKAAEEQNKGNSEVAAAWLKVVATYEQQAEALLEGDYEAAERYAQAAVVLGYGSGDSPGVAWAYAKAAEGPNKGNSEVAAAWLKVATTCEQQADALLQGKEEEAKSYQEEAKSYQEEAERYQGVANAHKLAAEPYGKAAEEQKKGNSEVATAWLKVANTYEQQAEALLQGDQEAAKRYGKAAKVLGSYNKEGSYWKKFDSGAAWAYGEAVKQQEKGKIKLAEKYRKQARDCERQAEALLKGDGEPISEVEPTSENESNNEEEFIPRLPLFSRLRKQALQRAKEQNQLKSEDHQQAALCYQREAKVYEKDSKFSDDTNRQNLIDRWDEEALAERRAGNSHVKAASAEERGHTSSVALYRKVAEAYTCQAECYQVDDEELAKQEGRVAFLLGRAAECQSRIPFPAETLETSSWAISLASAVVSFEEAAKVAAQNAEEESERQENLGECYWGQALEMQELLRQEKQKNYQAVTCYRTLLQLRESQLRACENNKEEAARFQGRLIELQKSAAWAYEQAAYQRTHDYSAAAERYEKQAQEYLQYFHELQEQGSDPGALEKISFEKKAQSLCEEVATEQKLAATAREEDDGFMAGLHEKKADYLVALIKSYEKRSSAPTQDQKDSYDRAIASYEKALQKSDEAASFSKRGETTASEQAHLLAACEARLANCYYGIAQGEADKNPEATLYYQKSEAATQEEKKALQQGDLIAAQGWREKAIALGGDEQIPGVAWASREAAYQEKRRSNVLTFAYEKIMEVCKKEVEALFQNNSEEAENQKFIANGLKEALNREPNLFLRSYELALRAKNAAINSRGEVQIAYDKVREAYERQAEALLQGDKEMAKCYRRVAKANSEAVWAYGKAAKEQKEVYSKIATVWLKVATTYEQQAEALLQEDQEAAERYRQAAKVLGSYNKDGYSFSEHYSGAAWAYGEAAKEQKKGNSEASAAWTKAAKTHEQQAEALLQGNQEDAQRYGQAAKVLGGSHDSPGAAWAYGKAAEEQNQGNSKVATAWIKAAKIYEQQAEALLQGDQEKAERYGQAAEVLGGYSDYSPGAAWAYGEAAEEQNNGTSKAATAWLKVAHAWEQQAEALLQGDEEAAERYGQTAEVLAKVLRKTTESYEKAAQEQNDGNSKVAAAWIKLATTYKQQAEALLQGDQEKAERYGQAAEVLGGSGYSPGAAWAYGKAAEEQNNGTSKAATAWIKAAKIYEQQAEALLQGDEETAERYKQAARAAWAYAKAAEEQKKGNSEVAAAWVKVAHACEQQAEALLQGKQEETECHAQTVKILREAVESYGKAAEEQKKGNTEVAAAWVKVAHACEQQAEALLQGKQEETECHAQTVKILREAVESYGKAAEEQKKGNTEVAAVWFKVATTCEQQAEALLQGNQEETERHAQTVKILREAVESYEEAASEQKKGNSKIAALWAKSAAANEQQAEALLQGDQEAAKRYKQKAKILGGSNYSPGAAWAYGKAAEEQKEENNEVAAAWIKVAAAWIKVAHACEQQTEALLQGKSEDAQRYGQAAGALGSYIKEESFYSGAAWAYEKAAGEQNKGNNEVAAAWIKVATTCEQEAEALLQGDQKAAGRYRQAAKVLGSYNKEGVYWKEYNSGAAWAYGKAAEEQNQENSEVAAAWIKVATTYEQQAEALLQGKPEEAERCEQVAKVLGGSFDYSRGVVWAYGKAAEEQKEGNSEVAAAWIKVAHTYEQQAEALIQGDQEAAKRYGQAATVLGSYGNNVISWNEYNSGAAWAYEKAAGEQNKGNNEVAAAWIKVAHACEQQAEALLQEKPEEARRYGQAAKVLGSYNKEGVYWKEYNSGAAWAYGKAAEEQNKGNNEVASAWIKVAHAYERQAEALIQGDQEATSWEIKGNDARAEAERLAKAAVFDSAASGSEDEFEDSDEDY